MSQDAIDQVIDIAIEHFSRDGYSDTKLEAISRESGMSKRMIHYHFGDKKGLYQQALARAASQLNPEVENLELDSAVPVEGVRQLVDWIFQQHIDHPTALRMMSMETSQRVLGSSHQAVVDVSALSLHLDRLLMHGQDSGAFRPGISANDIFMLISSLTSYRLNNQAMIENLLGVDMLNDANTTGIHRLIVDTVLAFLTANIPDSGHKSYLTSDRFNTEEGDAASPQDIYDI